MKLRQEIAVKFSFTFLYPDSRNSFISRYCRG